jgi:hypothetical protein
MADGAPARSEVWWDTPESFGVRSGYTPFSGLGSDLGFFRHIEDLAVQQFISHPAVEDLDVAILPGTPRPNEQRIHAQMQRQSSREGPGG